MKLAFVVLFLLLSVIGVQAGSRQDYVVNAGEWYEIPVGRGMVYCAIRDSVAKVYVNFGGREKEFEKVSGFATNDTNRTLIFTGYGAKLYHVAALDIGAGKVKVAVIAD